MGTLVADGRTPGFRAGLALSSETGLVVSRPLCRDPGTFLLELRHGGFCVGGAQGQAGKGLSACAHLPHPVLLGSGPARRCPMGALHGHRTQSHFPASQSPACQADPPGWAQTPVWFAGCRNNGAPSAWGTWRQV